MEIMVNTSLASYRFIVKNERDLVELIYKIVSELRFEDNEWEFGDRHVEKA